MTQFIREVVARLSGKAIVHAKCSDIKGRKSGGVRDNDGKDWYHHDKAKGQVNQY